MENINMSDINPQLLLVDENDQVIGHQSKLAAHLGEGQLHRAYSVFIFNRQGQLLLQQKAAPKPLWPGSWSNSCCSHPSVGVAIKDSAQCRVQMELGLEASVEYLYKFLYRAKYLDVGHEHELCHVFWAICDDLPKPNTDEVAAYQYIDIDGVADFIAANEQQVTPWFKMEWAYLQVHHLEAIKQQLFGELSPC